VLPMAVLDAVLVVFVVCPVALALGLAHPVRTSRLWVLALSVVCVGLSFLLTLSVLRIIINPWHRQMWRFAATWESDGCICGCSFPASEKFCQSFLGLLVFTCVRFAVLALRSIKGLRRASWANLLTVSFAVPAHAWEVDWARPDGSPIAFRREGEPVQGEPAFDPFAMMDEQPESASTSVQLRPCRVAVRSSCRKGLGRAAASTWAPEEPQPIGFFGFPCPGRPYQDVVEDSEEGDGGASSSATSSLSSSA